MCRFFVVVLFGSERMVLCEVWVLSVLIGIDVFYLICYVVCEDVEIVGVFFYIMEKVVGWLGKVVDCKVVYQFFFDSMLFEYWILFVVVDVLVVLVNVDYQVVGLQDFGKLENYL